MFVTPDVTHSVVHRSLAASHSSEKCSREIYKYPVSADGSFHKSCAGYGISWFASSWMQVSGEVKRELGRNSQGIAGGVAVALSLSSSKSIGGEDTTSQTTSPIAHNLPMAGHGRMV